jgi:UDP-N-acetylglucosamine 2-epimerase (non-hydrolysing)
MKVMTILGTRPEIIRLSCVMARLEATDVIDHVLVHTGQNYDYELNQVFFDDLGVRAPDHFLECDTSSVGRTYGDILIKSEEVLLRERPDAVLILGDTNSAIAAIIARRMHIPVFHMEAGNRSFDWAVPEETNRRIVDHISDVNLVYTEHARQNLLREGIHPQRIYLTGSPMFEVLNTHRAQIDASTVLKDEGLVEGEYVIVSLHREENVDNPERLVSLMSTLRQIAADRGWKVIVSTHPRTRKRLEEQDLVGGMNDDVVFSKPFGFFDYNKLQMCALAAISDSGTISEEASILGFPAITPRAWIERPEALDTGSVIMTGLDPEVIVDALSYVIEYGRPVEIPADYQIPNTSDRVLRLLLGRDRRLRSTAR